MILIVQHSGKGNTIETIKMINGCQRWRQQRHWEMNRWSTGDVKGSETVLYDSVMAGSRHCALVKTHRSAQHKE